MRGVLQGLGDYRAVGISLVGEQATRLAIGGVLAAVGLGVTGAYIGTPLSFVAMMLYCAIPLRHRLGAGRARTDGPPSGCGRTCAAPGPPIAALAEIAVLQNIDIIAAKHQFSSDWPAPTARPPWRPRC